MEGRWSFLRSLLSLFLSLFSLHISIDRLMFFSWNNLIPTLLRLSDAWLYRVFAWRNATREFLRLLESAVAEIVLWKSRAACNRLWNKRRYSSTTAREYLGGTDVRHYRFSSMKGRTNERKFVGENREFSKRERERERFPYENNISFFVDKFNRENFSGFIY